MENTHTSGYMCDNCNFLFYEATNWGVWLPDIGSLVPSISFCLTYFYTFWAKKTRKEMKSSVHFQFFWGTWNRNKTNGTNEPLSRFWPTGFWHLEISPLLYLSSSQDGAEGWISSIPLGDEVVAVHHYVEVRRRERDGREYQEDVISLALFMKPHLMSWNTRERGSGRHWPDVASAPVGHDTSVAVPNGV